MVQEYTSKSRAHYAPGGDAIITLHHLILILLLLLLLLLLRLPCRDLSPPPSADHPLPVMPVPQVLRQQAAIESAWQLHRLNPRSAPQ